VVARSFEAERKRSSLPRSERATRRIATISSAHGCLPMPEGGPSELGQSGA
jgi:hypothetical protein